MQVALIQQKFLDTQEKTIQRTIHLIEFASKQGAKLVVLQELHQNRYFCINENQNNFKFAQNYKLDLEFWAQIAKKFSIVLVTSLFEKRANGLYHNSAIVFEKDGNIAGKYRKMHIPDDPGFYEKFYFTPGDLGFNPISTSVGKLGVLICWDQWFPEAARIMSLKGADMLIYPTAIGWFDEDSEDEKRRQLESWITIQKSHSIANAIPVLSVNRVGFEKDDQNHINGIRFWGNSLIFASGGELIKFASNYNEEILQADIDLKQSDNIRQIWPFFRDRRVEYYQDIEKIYID